MRGKVLIKAESKSNIFSIICFVLAALTFFLTIYLIDAVDDEFGLLFLLTLLFLIVGLVLLSALRATITVTTSFVYVETRYFVSAIPVNKITGIKMGLLGTVSIRAASCGFTVMFVEETEKVYSRIFDAIEENTVA